MTAADHEDRLKAMTEPDQQTWDLSRNDVAAIAWALAEIDRLRREKQEAVTLLVGMRDRVHALRGVIGDALL